MHRVVAAPRAHVWVFDRLSRAFGYCSDEAAPAVIMLLAIHQLAWLLDYVGHNVTLPCSLGHTK
jgi:hypothetical protein